MLKVIAHNSQHLKKILKIFFNISKLTQQTRSTGLIHEFHLIQQRFLAIQKELYSKWISYMRSIKRLLTENPFYTHTEKSHIHRYTYPKKWKARIKDDPEKKNVSFIERVRIRKKGCSYQEEEKQKRMIKVGVGADKQLEWEVMVVAVKVKGKC